MTKKCTNCKNDSFNKSTIPLIASECEAVRTHNIIKRLIFVILILSILLFGSNLAWIIYDKQFEVVSETYDIEQEAEFGSNSCVINGGDLING